MTIGASRSWTPALSRDDLLGPVPPEPTFSEPIEHVRDRAAATIGKVTVPQKLDRPHPVIAKLLQEDVRRREKQAAWGTASSVYPLLYDMPHQRRRQRILSAIFVALARCGCRAEAWGVSAYDEPAEEFVITVGHQQVRLLASVIDPKGRSVRKRDASRTKDLRLRIELDPGDRGQSGGKCWEDDAEPLEKKAAAIAVAVLVKGEKQYRFGVLNAHAWRIRRKAALEEEIRKALEDAERRERERLQALERQRVERLLGEAEALRQASDIRRYVLEAIAANAASPEPVSVADLNTWRDWALAQADRIDPVRNRSFACSMQADEAC